MSKKGIPVFRKSFYAFNWKHKFFPSFFQNVFWEIPRQFFRDLKYCGQRIQKGYCDKDVWDLDYWFELVIADMLQDFRDVHIGYPISLIDDTEDLCKVDPEKEQEHSNKWNAILDEMIFLFREMNEDTCSKQNPLEKEWHRRYKEFEKQYGLFGEKLKTEEDRKDEQENRRVYHYGPWDLPENEAFYEQYYEEDRKLDAYREECKDKAFALFSKWFYALWE